MKVVWNTERGGHLRTFLLSVVLLGAAESSSADPPPTIDLENLVIETDQIYEACDWIRAGPSLQVLAPGKVLFRAINYVELRSGFSVGPDAIFSAVVPETTSFYAPYAPLMNLIAPIGPLLVTGSAQVPPCALDMAGLMLGVMLRNRFDVAEVLRSEGALTAVFARTEGVCDLPYFADLVGQPACDAAGGLGGVPGRPATACSEKNVLSQADDEFLRGTDMGENVCVHELAHTIMNVGLTDGDRTMIQNRYQQALLEGLWTGDFALENADEFFAEMSQAYFCANPEVPTFLHTHGINCGDELAAYDPATFGLIDDIYRGYADLR